MRDSEGKEKIRCEVRDGLAILTLNRPDDRNPLDRETAVDLLGKFEELFMDSQVRCVAVTGAGSAFSAGGDLQQLKRSQSNPADVTFNWAAPTIELSRRMLSAPKPVIAAVNGPAYAGGMGLAGMCDIILAVESARFALPEVKIGLFPIAVVAHLCRALPRKKLLEMMFTGEPLGAPEAHQLGFVNHVYPDRESMMAGLESMAASLLKASPDAVRLGRRTFNILSELPADQALDAAQFMLMPFHLGDAVREGADAFLSRRPAPWTVLSENEPS